MADTTTDSEFMEVEDSSDSMQIEKNGLADYSIETGPILAKTSSDLVEPMEEDSLSNSNHDIEEDSMINESEAKEDGIDNASDSLEAGIAETPDTTAVENEVVNGDGSLVEPPDTTASVETNIDVSLNDKESNIDNDTNMDAENNIDNKADNEAAPVEAETTVSSVAETTVSSVLSEKHLASDSETDSPKPSVVSEITEEGSKNSPESVSSNLSPLVKDRLETNEDSSKANDVKDKDNDEKVDSTENAGEIKEDSKEQENENEPKEKSKSSKEKKKKKTCANCGEKKKKLPLRIAFQGKLQQLCSEECFKAFKEKNMTKPPPAPTPRLVNDNCAECQKRIENKSAYFPSVGEVKPLCSEACLMKYQMKHSPPIFCGQCKEKISSAYNRLTWETMAFCNDTCLFKYQTDLGSHCTSCHGPVQRTSLGKYCVCFGSDIRQFCSGGCLEEFKKGLKICSFCQNDLSAANTDGFLAPVGEKGQFKDFCSPTCMERYENMNNINKAQPVAKPCYTCKKEGYHKIQVQHGGQPFALCSDMCLSVFRCTFQIADNICRNCSERFKTNDKEVFSFIYEGFSKHFCTKSCMTLFVLSNRKIIHCLSCKVKKYNFDMIERLDATNQFQMFCSASCLNNYRLHYGGGTNLKINCDGCNKSSTIQYHLTMGDGSTRNFCSYDCVEVFQGVKRPAPMLINSQGMNSSPIIESVESLAPESQSGSPQIPSKPQSQFATLPPGGAHPAGNSTRPHKVQSPSTSANSPTVLTANAHGRREREVIVRPPVPKSHRNKTVSCKPIMATKGISVKSQTCNKAVQTDDARLPSILPVPFPIYLPSPMMMYNKTISFPMPFPVPIPIPVPVFINKERPCSRCHASTSEASSMEVEPVESHETESAKSVETNSAETVEIKSARSVETDSGEPIVTCSPKSIETDSAETIEIKSAKSVETDGAETTETKTAGTPEPKSAEIIETKLTETVETKSAESIETKSPAQPPPTKPTETVETKSTEPVEAKSTETIETKSKQTVEANPAETIEEKSDESLETNAGDITVAESPKTSSTEVFEALNHKVATPSPKVCSPSVENKVPTPETIDISFEVPKDSDSIPPESVPTESSSNQVTGEKTNSQDSPKTENPLITPKIEPIDEDISSEIKPRRKKRSGEDLIVTEGKKAKVEEDYIEVNKHDFPNTDDKVENENVQVF